MTGSNRSSSILVKRTSRKAPIFYLRWVGKVLGEAPASLEDLSDGIAYLKLLEKLYPGTINVKTLKDKNEGSARKNFQTLKDNFRKLKIQKSVPVGDLVGVENQTDNQYDFVQWFYEFYKCTRCADDFKKCLTNDENKIHKALKIIIQTAYATIIKAIKYFENSIKVVEHPEYTCQTSNANK